MDSAVVFPMKRGSDIHSAERSPVHWHTMLGALGPFREASKKQSSLHDPQEQGAVDHDGIGTLYFQENVMAKVMFTMEVNKLAEPIMEEIRILALRPPRKDGRTQQLLNWSLRREQT